VWPWPTTTFLVSCIRFAPAKVTGTPVGSTLPVSCRRLDPRPLLCHDTRYGKPDLSGVGVAGARFSSALSLLFKMVLPGCLAALAITARQLSPKAQRNPDASRPARRCRNTAYVRIRPSYLPPLKLAPTTLCPLHMSCNCFATRVRFPAAHCARPNQGPQQHQASRRTPAGLLLLQYYL